MASLSSKAQKRSETPAWRGFVDGVYDKMAALDGINEADRAIPLDTRIGEFERAVEDCIEAFEGYYEANDAARQRRIFELRHMPYTEYLQTDEWRYRRDNHVARTGFHCQLCGEKQGASASLQVHHSTYERLGNEAPEDIIALCPGCHSRFHDLAMERRA